MAVWIPEESLRNASPMLTHVIHASHMYIYIYTYHIYNKYTKSMICWLCTNYTTIIVLMRFTPARWGTPNVRKHKGHMEGWS